MALPKPEDEDWDAAAADTVDENPVGGPTGGDSDGDG